MIAYTVICDFTTLEVAREWIGWLEREHLRDVLAAGAEAAEVVMIDSPPEGAAVRCEVRYRFTSRQSFERYEREEAPRLRAEGLQRFPLDRGLAYTRTTGEIVARCP